MLAYLDYMFQYAKERAHEQIPKHAYTPSAVKVAFVCFCAVRSFVCAERVCRATASGVEA